MTFTGIVQVGLFFAVLLALVKPLGWYMARVYECKPIGLDRIQVRSSGCSTVSAA